MSSEIHAIMFKKSKYKIDDIIDWLNKHKIKGNYLESKVKKNYYWVNITPKERYKSFSAYKIKKKGLIFIFGWK